MARIVFGVWTGEYSDRGLQGLFEREEDAQAEVDEINARVRLREDRAEMEELVLYAPGERRVATVTWHVQIDLPPRPPEVTAYCLTQYGPIVTAVPQLIEVLGSAVVGSGPDRERLIKAAREVHARELARREGIA